MNRILRITSKLAAALRAVICLAAPVAVVTALWMLPQDRHAPDDAVDELYAAVTTHDAGGVKRALARGAWVDSTEGFSTVTPLIWAARGGNLEIVQILLEHGASVRVQSRAFGTPLSNAAASGNPALVQILLERGADPDAGRPDGSSPLMCAVMAGDAQAASMLIKAGADARLRNRAGQNAADLAREDKNETVLHVLGVAADARD
jgi:hypothetical protein